VAGPGQTRVLASLVHVSDPEQRPACVQCRGILERDTVERLQVQVQGQAAGRRSWLSCHEGLGVHWAQHQSRQRCRSTVLLQTLKLGDVSATVASEDPVALHHMVLIVDSNEPVLH
jgi:hypothetical protein